MSKRITVTEVAGKALTAEQSSYLDGLFAGLRERGLRFADVAPDPLAAEKTDDVIDRDKPFRLDDTATSEERIKEALHPLDAYSLLLQHAAAKQGPDKENTFRFKWQGLFYLTPNHEAYMARLRLPGGVLKSWQLRELAQLIDDLTTGYIQITTRANLQVRLIAPADAPEFLRRLQSIGLMSKGSGADNIRNLTCDPTSGLDPDELIETLPLTQQLGEYLQQHREFYNLPRKFNIALSGGGRISSVADTNDIGYRAVRVVGPSEVIAAAAPAGGGAKDAVVSDKIRPGVWFRLALGGATGLKAFAKETEVLVDPAELIEVTDAILRVYIRKGNRSDRKKARLKHLLETMSVAEFLGAVEEQLGRPLTKVALPSGSGLPRNSTPTTASDQGKASLGSQGSSRAFETAEGGEERRLDEHAHVGVFAQKQTGLHWVGVEVPVGQLTTRQLRRLADLSEHHGGGEVRLTVWQSLVLPHVKEAYVETVKKAVVRMGLDWRSSPVKSGFVACTGNRFCKYAATDTKGHALELRRFLEDEVRIDQPVNIHLTGCPHSCAQHYIGDIGLLGTKVKVSGESVEGYHVFVGGGFGDRQGLGRQVFQGISYEQLKPTLVRMLKAYMEHRVGREPFGEFTRRYELGRLQEMFT